MPSPLPIPPWTIHLLTSGSFALDGGAMFGSVPKALWQRTNPADKANRITMLCRHWLIEGRDPAGGGADRRILVDTGPGHKLSAKEARIYRLEQPENAMETALQRAGFSCEQVTDVILTHLHFDHAGGATTFDGNEIVPAFPNATYYVQRSQWVLANNPSLKDRASYLPGNFVPLERYGQLELLDGPGELFPGVELLVNEGHTDGHQLVKVTGGLPGQGGQTAVFMGDLIPLASHLRLPYIMGYDLRPLQTLAEKQRLLAQAAAEDWWLFFDHDPEVPGVRIKPGGKDYKIVERYGDG